MIHPIPPGTSDVLPDEMRELRKLDLALIEVFEARGYGEVATPAIEYDEVLARGDGRSAGVGLPLLRRAAATCWRCAPNMTVPIARLVATRYAGAEMPRAPLLPGQRLPRGASPARPDARVHPGRGRADRRPGAAGHGRGDRGPRGGARRGRPRPRRDRPRRRRPLPPAARRVRRRGRGARLDPRAAGDTRPRRPRGGALRGRGNRRRAVSTPASPSRSCAAGARCSTRPAPSAARRSSGRRRGSARPSRRSSARGAADRVQIDLGLLRDLGYYSGAILEVYDPALGHVLGGGGRYDGLLKRFGARPARGRLRPLPGARPRRPDGGGAPRGGWAPMSGGRRHGRHQGGRPAEAGGAARRPARRHPRPARRGRDRHRRGPRRVAGADLPRRGDHPGDDAPLRRADLRRGRRRRRRHHRQGRPARAGRPRRLRAARPRLRPLPHGARRPQGRRRAWANPSGAWG